MKKKGPNVNFDEKQPREDVPSGSVVTKPRSVIHLARRGHLNKCRFNIAGGSVHGEQANVTGLVLSCIEAKFCKYILVGISSLESSRRDLRNALLWTVL